MMMISKWISRSLACKSGFRIIIYLYPVAFMMVAIVWFISNPGRLKFSGMLLGLNAFPPKLGKHRPNTRERERDEWGCFKNNKWHSFQCLHLLSLTGGRRCGEKRTQLFIYNLCSWLRERERDIESCKKTTIIFTVFLY